MSALKFLQSAGRFRRGAFACAIVCALLCLPLLCLAPFSKHNLITFLAGLDWPFQFLFCFLFAELVGELRNLIGREDPPRPDHRHFPFVWTVCVLVFLCLAMLESLVVQSMLKPQSGFWVGG